VLVAALLCWPALAETHPFSISYAHVQVEPQTITATIRLPLDDMDLLLRIDRDVDGTVADGEIAAAAPALLRYLTERVRVRADGVTPAPSLVQTGRWADSTGFPYVEAVLRYSIARPPAALALQIDLLTDLYRDHRTLAAIVRGDRRDEFVFQHGNTFEASHDSWWQTARTFLVLGVEHILTGYDHLLFLLALLVAGRGMRQLVAIVTSFTVAHSLTLGAATFGLIEPPPRLIEAAIALSIAYVGVENLLVKDVRGRWRVTFVFGLVHGFGFANVLREMELPRAALASSLFTFNAGVELGQLAVLLVVWPVLRAVQKSAYAVTITRAVSAVVIACGVFWFVQRVM
jgi:hydrogenase/urease accessory protein HupE